MALSDEFNAAVNALRDWFAGNGGLSAEAVSLVDQVETAGKNAVDAAVTQAAPTVAPEVLPTLNGLLDQADAAVDAKLAADIAALQAQAAEAKAANAATRTAINPQ